MKMSDVAIKRPVFAVVISLLLGALVGGLSGGLDLAQTLAAFNKGITNGAAVALSYALLGAFAVAIAKSGLPHALADAAVLEAMLVADGQPAPLEPWDWRYYSEKRRLAEHDLDEAELKPYFKLDAMIASHCDADHYGGLADLLDGFVARRQQRQTELGQRLDIETDAAGLLVALLWAPFILANLWVTHDSQLQEFNSQLQSYAVVHSRLLHQHAFVLQLLRHRAHGWVGPIELGVDDYLGKPYQESQLLDAIEPLVLAFR